ncbi:Inositol-3-phosphate synthase [Seminavis robusta]|uniref:inositol-3-phosphate synthase n=1 Tax=Seminavis robusta TaxID=568900 RepID=A0A9N8E863_9STRA|nr:Inositol-3-phosphate synthase [Seminavis robusta]|eukprot:Sro726_g193420.1 Inositol-3-phosphate synthase (481) ;mRNA; r:8797-10239
MSGSDSNKIGILIVGLGGNNGVTLLAGHTAAKHGLSWESGGCPGKGRVSAPNWGGCITQLPPKGVHGGVGFQGVYDLASAQEAAVGGWDIRPTPLGDALYECRVLDYDLVRQVREEMNSMEIKKGIYNSTFLGETQHATATHIVDTASLSFWQQVEHIRKDIRDFNAAQQVTGHTTVIWSASVERPADVAHIQTAQQLLKILKDTAAQDISPSMIYATAAALEGCSFVNGGSQNTLGPALNFLFELSFRTTLLEQEPDTATSTKPAYLLGTDFKAGQTKFKTAAVEYIRALGLTPRVIASSNHLGNNDMLNLTSQTTLNAKMRVKHSIFGPWNEQDLDHQVKVMYVPFMGDEKRDVVEYTSTAFLHQEHTMLTYTRCMDSVLCVPLMIDSAVWCDFFARHNTASNPVAKATAYLFKIPEGGAQGVDPGFHHQMETLRTVLKQVTNAAATDDKKGVDELLLKGLAAGILSQEQVNQLKALA